VAQSHEFVGDAPLGVSLGETPAGIRVLRWWRKATNLLGMRLSVFRCAKRLPAFMFCAGGAKP